MHTDQIYIARDGKSGMHVLVRILAVDDIGKDYLPIDPDDFNKLMMARDVRSLVLAARDLGPMYISADILSRRIFIPSHLRQHIEHGVNLAPSDIESLLSECYFDPYALPVETDDMGYRAIGRTGKKSTRELIDELDFTKAGDLSYLDSQFRAIVEPLHDWIFARNLLSILIRIGGLYRFDADPDTILEAARFRQVNPMVLKKRFDIDTDTCYAIPIAFNPIYRMENLADNGHRSACDPVHQAPSPTRHSPGRHCSALMQGRSFPVQVQLSHSNQQVSNRYPLGKNHSALSIEPFFSLARR